MPLRRLLSTTDASIHGPRLEDVFESPRGWVIAIWVLVTIPAIFVLVMYFKFHRPRLLKAPRSFYRENYFYMAMLPPIMCSASALAAWLVRPAYIFDLVRVSYEAFTLMKFQRLLIGLLCANNVNKVDLNSKFDEEDSDYSSPEERRRKEAEHVLALAEPEFLLSVPPVCCICRPCDKKQRMSSELLTMAKRLTSQYLYIAPAIAIINLWIELDQSDADVQDGLDLPASGFTGAVKTASMILALWGLFMTYKATHEILKHLRPTAKFVAIKLVLIISALQTFIISASVPNPTPEDDYDQEARASMYSNTALAVESVLTSLLIYRAFPASELFALQGKQKLASINVEDGPLLVKPPVGYQANESSEREET